MVSYLGLNGSAPPWKRTDTKCIILLNLQSWGIYVTHVRVLCVNRNPDYPNRNPNYNFDTKLPLRHG